MANRSEVKITKLAHLQGHRGAIYHFSAHENQLFSVGSDGHVVSWQPLEHGDGRSLLRSDETWYCSYIDPLDGSIYAGSRTGRLIGVDPVDGRILYDTVRHRGSVFFICKAFGQLVSGGQDGVLVVGDAVHQLSDRPLRSVLVEDDAIWVGDSGGRIHHWRNEVIRTWQAHDRAVFGLTRVGGQIASTGLDARIHLWNRDGLRTASVPAHDRQGKSLDFNGQYLLSSSMDGSIRLWGMDLQLFRHIDRRKDDGHTNSVNRVLWMDSYRFASCSDDGTIIVWQVELIT